jgi:hypothetical protein
VGYEAVSAASTTKLRSGVDFGDRRDVRGTPSDCDYGRKCAAIHEVDPYEAMVNKVLGLSSGLVHVEGEWGLRTGESSIQTGKRKYLLTESSANS